MDNPKATWQEAKKALSTSQRVVVEQAARMKEAQKERQAAFHRSDWSAAKNKWSKLAANNPEERAAVKFAQKKMELKLVFGKEVLTEEQRLLINGLLGKLDTESYNFGTYWGY